MIFVNTYTHSGLIETMQEAVHSKDFDNQQKEVIQDILVCVGLGSEAWNLNGEIKLNLVDVCN